ncbi:unnamed protein product [Lactuca virosa]|uniref:Fungal lipase-like domain-containing protein n=1 Tax=Lactuca virosa TaxID=75947 RepID=A0AAU9M9U4_9ASTR|nr:unnamed protein product [Lactuca virosa]
MVTVTMATIAGAAALLYYTLNKKLQSGTTPDDEEESDSLIQSHGPSGVERVSNRLIQAPATWLETISTLSETLRFTYSETLGNLHVSSVYGGEESMQLTEETGFSPEDVLIQEPKAGTKAFLLLIRGTHSIKDTLTAATGAVVPFHHTVVHEGGVTNLVLGYAHCGMLAAARWIVKLATPLLLKAFQDYLNYKLQIVGHSLGGGTAAVLTYVLREHKELSATTCVTFAPEISFEEVDKTESSEIEVIKDVEDEFDVETVIKKQETHNLFCPNCNSCITKRVILRKRKRKIPVPGEIAKRNNPETSNPSEVNLVSDDIQPLISNEDDHERTKKHRWEDQEYDELEESLIDRRKNLKQTPIFTSINDDFSSNNGGSIGVLNGDQEKEEEVKDLSQQNGIKVDEDDIEKEKQQTLEYLVYYDADKGIWKCRICSWDYEGNTCVTNHNQRTCLFHETKDIGLRLESSKGEANGVDSTFHGKIPMKDNINITIHNQENDFNIAIHNQENGNGLDFVINNQIGEHEKQNNLSDNSLHPSEISFEEVDKTESSEIEVIKDVEDEFDVETVIKKQGTHDLLGACILTYRSTSDSVHHGQPCILLSYPTTRLEQENNGMINGGR